MTRLTAIKQRCEAATEGPWRIERDDDFYVLSTPPGTGNVAVACYTTPHDAAHIAHSPEDIHWLLGLVERARLVVEVVAEEPCALGGCSTDDPVCCRRCEARQLLKDMDAEE